MDLITPRTESMLPKDICFGHVGPILIRNHPFGSGQVTTSIRNDDQIPKSVSILFSTLMIFPVRYFGHFEMIFGIFQSLIKIPQFLSTFQMKVTYSPLFLTLARHLLFLSRLH